MNTLLTVTNDALRNLRKLVAVFLTGIALSFGIWATFAQTTDKQTYPAWWDAPPAANAPSCTICHRPPGNPPNEHTLTIGCSGADAHLRNHPLDCTGECPCQGTGIQNN